MFHRYTLLALTCFTVLGLTSTGAKASFSSSQSANTESGVSSAIPPDSLQPYSRSDSDLFLTAQALEPPASSAAAGGLLGPGSRGEEVRNLQRRLHNLGYYKANIDGTYGPETKLAVSQFQRDVGLSETGFVDPATWQRIEISQLLPSSGSATADSASGSPPDAPETSPAATVSPAPSAPPDAAQAPAANPTNAPPPSNNGISLLAQPSLSPAPAQNAEPSSQESSGWLLWFLLVGIGLLSFGTGLFFAKRSANKSLAADYYDADQATGLSAFNSNKTARQTQASHARPTSHSGNRNGLAAASEETVQGIAPAPQSMAVENTTTRLSRVNIIDELVGDLQSPDPSKRRKAVWELGQRGDSNAVQPLVDLIIDADSKERSLILAALSEIGIRVLKPMNRALAISLQDPNPEVRKNAIRDLTRIYDMAVQVSQMLTHVTEDPDPEVRETAFWAMEQLNRIRSIPEADTILSLRDSTKSGNLKEGAELTDLLPEEIQHSSDW